MTQDKEMLALVQELDRVRAIAETLSPGSTIARPRLVFADSQFAGYVPRTPPGTPTKYWKIGRHVCVAAAFMLAGAMVWNYFATRSRTAGTSANGAVAEIPATDSSAAAASSGNASGGSGTDVSTAQPGASTVPYANRLRPDGLLNLLSTGGKRIELLRIDQVRLRADRIPLKATVVLYGRLDERTERHWREAGVLSKTALPVSPFLQPVTIANEEALDLLRDWHVEGVVVKK